MRLKPDKFVKREFSPAICLSAAPQVPSLGLVGIDGGVVSGVFNLESPGVGALGRRPRHEERYHDA